MVGFINDEHVFNNNDYSDDDPMEYMTEPNLINESSNIRTTIERNSDMIEPSQTFDINDDLYIQMMLHWFIPVENNTFT